MLWRRNESAVRGHTYVEMAARSLTHARIAWRSPQRRDPTIQKGPCSQHKGLCSSANWNHRIRCAKISNNQSFAAVRRQLTIFKTTFQATSLSLVAYQPSQPSQQSPTWITQHRHISSSSSSSSSSSNV